jgi:hypothetical protein
LQGRWSRRQCEAGRQAAHAVTAIDSGLIPLSLAVIIARSNDAGIQQALADA